MPEASPLSADSAPNWLRSLAPRLQQQLAFLAAIDALKTVNRATRISDNSRQENSAEHSWHLTLFARILHEHANQPVDIERVIMMLMVHDIVEIDAGDMPLHGEQNPDQAVIEQAAAKRLFGLLPDDQAKALEQIWHEFEKAESAEARFAKAVDRLQPILLNMLTEGGTWHDYNVSIDQVVSRTGKIAIGSESLWAAANAMFSEAQEHGWLKKAPPTGSS